MGIPAMMTPTVTSTFRGQIDPDWDPEAEPGSQSLSVIARDGLPLSRSLAVRIDSLPDITARPEPGPHAPFAYQFAQPIADPPVDPSTVPRLSTHNSALVKVYCGGYYWWRCIYRSD
jgi:hypothetical protein